MVVKDVTKVAHCCVRCLHKLGNVGTGGINPEDEQPSQHDEEVGAGQKEQVGVGGVAHSGTGIDWEDEGKQWNVTFDALTKHVDQICDHPKGGQ